MRQLGAARGIVFVFVFVFVFGARVATSCASSAVVLMTVMPHWKAEYGQCVLVASEGTDMERCKLRVRSSRAIYFAGAGRRDS